MLPPQPLPDVPHGAPEPPEAAGRLPVCLLALFCLGWFFWDFWSCGLLFRSKVCAQPVAARDREQNSARRIRFFFTGPPLSFIAEGTRGPGFPRRYLDLAKAAPTTRQQLCSHVVSRCRFR